MCMCMRSAAIDVSLSASPLEVPISFATFLRVYLLHLNDVCVCYFVCVRVPRFLLLAIHLFLPFRLLPFRFFPPFSFSSILLKNFSHLFRDLSSCLFSGGESYIYILPLPVVTHCGVPSFISCHSPSVGLYASSFASRVFFYPSSFCI